MNNIEKYSDKDWEKLASLLSGETTETSEKLERFREEDHYRTEKQWNNMGKVGNDRRIDVDNAWNKIYSRIEENELPPKILRIESRFSIRTFIRLAATALIIIGFGYSMVYLNNSGAFSKKIVVSANSQERNIEVRLPDGSIVYLNRNSELSYSKFPGHSSRNVVLKGEAFFEIKRDPSKPFIIDAQNAKIKVLGTSFSVLTNNAANAVEVFVKTGSVMVSDNSGTKNLILEPGFIGTMNSTSSTKAVNENPNYLSWNTDTLIYDGKKLEVVIADLKKTFNINVVPDNTEILSLPITATFYNQPEDAIIQVICATFNLSSKKDGSVYHLSEK